MAQADQSVQNASFPAVRADINNNLAALFSNSSGATAPTVTLAFQDWIDTSGANPLWKKRNAANNAWITLGTISGNTLAFEGTLPSQTGNAGGFLTTNGTTASWLTIPPGSSSQIFGSSGTWVKPSAGTIALVHLWGGGGGGGRNGGGSASGGGGAACSHKWFQLSELPSTVSVTIAAGGAGRAASGNGAGIVGGTSTFGGLISAFGGGPGTTASNGFGGGGGSLVAGSISVGGVGFGIIDSGAASDGGRSDFGGAAGGTAEGGTSIWGGGGGRGVSTNTVGEPGGSSIHGGNGGPGNIATPAGTSAGGGASRLSGVDAGSGGRGECCVYVW